MKTIRKILLAYALVLCLLILLALNAFAHSGGTDAQGGHRDNNNVSGLGSYHFHHGRGPHLHPNGVCPYSEPATSNFNKSNVNSGGNNIGMFILGGAFSLGALGVIRKILNL